MDKMIQEIFEVIEDSLPEGWKKVAFYSIYGERNFQMKYYVKLQNDSYKDCYKFIDEKVVMKQFIKINKIIKPYRKNAKDIWYAFSMVVDSNEKVKVFFEYEEVENFIKYEREWKKKYLK